jgi:hypothetical protein
MEVKFRELKGRGAECGYYLEWRQFCGWWVILIRGLRLLFHCLADDLRGEAHLMHATNLKSTHLSSAQFLTADVRKERS